MKPIMQKLGVTVAMLSIFLSASAYDFEVGGIYYNITNPTGKEVEVTSGLYGSYVGDIVVPSSVSYEGEDYNVTAIGSDAFSGISELTSITIPNSVTSIKGWAFSNCINLTNIEVAGENQTYSSKDGIVYNKSQTTIVCCPGGKEGDFIIPNSVTTIGESTFCGCMKLTTITIPSSVTTIEDYAFTNCSSLATITIPNSVTAIGESTFLNCSGLTTITIPGSVTTIEDRTFTGCIDLTTIEIPNTVTSIGNYAFDGCFGLRSITIPNSVTTIGEYTFSWCSSLTTITIPGSVTTIGDWTFSNCSRLTNIEVAGENQAYSSKDGILYNKSQTAIVCCPGGKEGEIIIPNTVTTIGESAFANCNSLTNIGVAGENQVYSSKDGILYDKSQTTLVRCPGGKAGGIVIPNSVTTIGDGAFSDCSGLTSIAIPNRVTTIGESAFYQCDGLTSITLPNSVRTIGDRALGGCSGLTSITSLAVTPPVCGNLVFSEVDYQTCTLYVPAGSLVAYKRASEWRDLNIVAEAGTGIDSIGAGCAAATEVFNLAGVKVADTPDNLPAGIYIVREGLTARKIVVR